MRKESCIGTFILIFLTSMSYSQYLPLTGGTLTGDLNIPSLTVTNGYVNGVAIGTGGTAVFISNQNLNNLTVAGFYRGSGLINAPDNGWWFVFVEGHDNSGGNLPGWTKQTITAFGADNSYSSGTTFIRNQIGGTDWTPWSKILAENTNGNVGIGTTSPSEKLSVTGNIGIPDGSFYKIISSNATVWSNTNLIGHGFNNYDYTSVLVAGHQPNTAEIRLLANGNVGIGTTSPTEKLSVNGNIRSKKITVTQQNWPDYVFDSSYTLQSLSQVEQFIKDNKHLPDVPSAKEVADKGLDLGDNQALLLKKIEELTLYMIEMKKENEEMKKENQKVRKLNELLILRIKKLETNKQ
ncbi:pyocin knob domain-containing protein [Chitinophagaceae bacterium LWZ2-11]